MVNNLYNNLHYVVLGDFNVLVSTPYVEEGVDIPSLKSVIRFDPIQHLPSFIQGRGRARTEKNRFITLAEQVTTFFTELH